MSKFIIILLSAAAIFITALISAIFNFLKADGKFLSRHNIIVLSIAFGISLLLATIAVFQVKDDKEEMIASTQELPKEQPKELPKENKPDTESIVDKKQETVKEPVKPERSGAAAIINTAVEVKKPPEISSPVYGDASVYVFEVSSLYDTELEIAEGDSVIISSTGSILLGPEYGSSTPMGVTKPLDRLFSIAKNIKHGALMLAVGENLSWSYCGRKLKMRAKKAGQLFFDVNDNDQANNSGFYAVTCTIRRKQ